MQFQPEREMALLGHKRLICDFSHRLSGNISAKGVSVAASASGFKFVPEREEQHGCFVSRCVVTQGQSESEELCLCVC